MKIDLFTLTYYSFGSVDEAVGRLDPRIVAADYDVGFEQILHDGNHRSICVHYYLVHC